MNEWRVFVKLFVSKKKAFAVKFGDRPFFYHSLVNDYGITVSTLG
jgi:hypothetical protein